MPEHSILLVKEYIKTLLNTVFYTGGDVIIQVFKAFSFVLRLSSSRAAELAETAEAETKRARAAAERAEQQELEAVIHSLFLTEKAAFWILAAALWKFWA